MRVDLQPAYVLHRRPYRNTSAILEVFSKEHGRVGIVARGLAAARGKSSNQALLQPFNKIIVSWSGRGELKTLVQVEPTNVSAVIPLVPTASMFYLNELLIRLLQRDDPHETLFDLYESIMTKLQQSTSQMVDELTLRFFEKNLLDELGYGLVLDSDATSGQAIEPETEYRYFPEMGPILNTPTLTGGVLVHGSSLAALANENIDSDRSRRETKQLMRYILRTHLGDKPLQSRMLYTSNY